MAKEREMAIVSMAEDVSDITQEIFNRYEDWEVAGIAHDHGKLSPMVVILFERNKEER